MKHVGLNVAADAFVNAAITGVNGGMIVVVADDPSMHSSQNEQDSRFYGKFSMITTLEPSTQQEAYDMMQYGFELSEREKLPVLMRIVMRLAHSRAAVTVKEEAEEVRALPVRRIRPVGCSFLPIRAGNMPHWWNSNRVWNRLRPKLLTRVTNRLRERNRWAYWPAV